MAHQPAISFSVAFHFPSNRAGGYTSNVLPKMIRILTLLLIFTCFVFSKDQKLETEISLFVIHGENPDGGELAATKSKSCKGFVANQADLYVSGSFDPIYPPQDIRAGPDGKIKLAEIDADLRLKFHEQDSKSLAIPHNKVGNVPLFFRVASGNTKLYYKAAFAPMTDNAIIVEGTATEKRRLFLILTRVNRQRKELEVQAEHAVAPDRPLPPSQ